MVLVDTRQQAGKHNHKNAWFTGHSVQTCAMKLDFGDYQRPGSNVSVDTKKDIQELVMDVGRDHARFVRECERAKAAGYKLVVLVESSAKYNDRDQLSVWVSKVCTSMCKFRWSCKPSAIKGRRCRRGNKPMQGDTLVKILDSMERNHGVRFLFTSKADAARRICEILGEPYGEL